MESTFDILNMKVKENDYMACIWPVADPAKTEAAEGVLRQKGKIIYAGDVTLTYLGMKNFMTQIYGHQAWTGTIHNQFRGTVSKVDACYRAGQPVKTYVFEASSLDAVLDIKEKIRKIYGIDKHSIHISDSAKETYDMIQLLYNKNSVDFLNHAHPYRYQRVYRCIRRAEELIAEKQLEKERFILGMDAVMEVCGLKKTQAVECMTDYSCNDLTETGIGMEMKHSAEEYGLTLSELLYDADHYFYFEGMKLAAPKCILKAHPETLTEKTTCMLERFVKQTGSEAAPDLEYRIKLRKMRSRYILKIKELIDRIRKQSR